MELGRYRSVCQSPKKYFTHKFPITHLLIFKIINIFWIWPVLRKQLAPWIDQHSSQRKDNNHNHSQVFSYLNVHFCFITAKLNKIYFKTADRILSSWWYIFPKVYIIYLNITGNQNKCRVFWMKSQKYLHITA